MKPNKPNTFRSVLETQCDSVSNSGAVCDQSPTLAERAKQQAEKMYDERFNFVTDDISKRVLAAPDKRTLAYDLNRYTGDKFKSPCPDVVMTRVGLWLEKEGFTGMPMESYRANLSSQRPRVDPHRDVYHGYSTSSFIISW